MEKRFGTIAIEKGFINKTQLQEALKQQCAENITTGTHRKLGQILVEMKVMTHAQVKDVLQTMDQVVLYSLAAGR